jgi:hypothetical protein
MRELLKPFLNVRTWFEATFERYGTKTNYNGYPEKTYLFLNITFDGKEVSDHLWLKDMKHLRDLGEFQKGDKIRFLARVTKYQKGYMGRRFDEGEAFEHPIETDYRLSFPTKIMRLNNSKEIILEKFK